jgi:hypothetical protein
MFRQGPVPAFIHGLLEYIAGAALIAAPFVLAYNADGTATAVSIVAGVVVLVLTASSALSTGLIKSIPVQAHVVLDYIYAALLIAAPFIFAFTGDGTATAVFVVLGVFHLLLTIATRFIREPRPPRRARAAREP